jgi:hypothetical protein
MAPAVPIPTRRTPPPEPQPHPQPQRQRRRRHRAQVQLALLTAAAKLFFKRPPEAQQLLGAALAGGLADSNQDVHDRALLYYRWAAPAGRLRVCIGGEGSAPGPPPLPLPLPPSRPGCCLWLPCRRLLRPVHCSCQPRPPHAVRRRLLRHDPRAAERVICTPVEALHHFSEDATAESQVGRCRGGRWGSGGGLQCVGGGGGRRRQGLAELEGGRCGRLAAAE